MAPARPSPTASPSPLAFASDVSALTSEAVSEMNISTSTEDNGDEPVEADDELATTPMGRTHPPQLPFSASRSLSYASQSTAKRPSLSHRISISSALFSVPSGPPTGSPYSRGRPGFSAGAASLPSPGWAGPSRDYFRDSPRQSMRDKRVISEASPQVAPQNDFLANWETLQDLVMPAPEGSRARSTSRRRDMSPAVGSVRSQRASESVGSTPGTFGRTASLNIPRAPSVTETDEEHETEDEGVPESSAYSGLLSSSPPNIDGFGTTPSFGVMSERMGGVDTPEPRRGILMPDTPRVTITPRPELPHSPQSAPPSGAPATPNAASKKPSRWTSWTPPLYWSAILKCAIAYVIASLFTFVPQLSNLLSMRSETDVHGRKRGVPAYSAHMVATIVVYFHPARTMGNMILSTRYCIILASLAALVSLLSFGIIRFFDWLSPTSGQEWDWISEMGDWVVCVFCVGGGMGALAWLKQWVNNPSFNTGCSMAAVTLFTVVVKEGGWIKLKEVLLIVAIGATITNIVCFTLMPASATTRLQASMTKSLDAFSTLLDILCSTFLLEQPHAKENRMPLAQAVKAHGAAFKSLKENLAEAKHERLVDPRMRGAKLELYDAALNSMARLAQHLAAMRSSTRLQEALLLANRDGRIDLDKAEKKSRHVAESVIYELGDLPTITIEEEADVEQSVKLFLQLQRMTGDDLDALVAQCDEALDAIEEVIGARTTKDTEAADVQGTRTAVAGALRDFSRSSSRAIKRIYAGPRRRKGVYDSDDSSSDDEPSLETLAMQAPQPVNEEGDDGPNEVIFVVYFLANLCFLFTLEEFARELLFLLDTVNEIIDSPPVTAMDQLRSFIAPWRKRNRKQTNFLYKQFQKLVPVDPSKLQPPLFPKAQRDERGTLLTPGRHGLSFIRRLYQHLWELGNRLSEPDMRYAIKTGLGGAILAAPAYIESTRSIFLDYRGEWALLAYFASMSMTVGQTNFLSFFRIIGTILGGSVAVVAYSLFPENPVALPMFGFFFSLPCFYIITQMPAYAQAGRFILLTYNLTCLYTYNLRENDLSPVTIALKRTTSIVAGVVWAALVTRWWWPFTARRELRNGLGDFFLDLSYLYSRLVTTYTRGVEPSVVDPNSTRDSPVIASINPPPPTERTPLLPAHALGLPPATGTTALPEHHLSAGVLQFMSMELHLQDQLAQLRGLLGHAVNEPRLKGPFPIDFYQEVLLSCERMLDRLHSMRCVTTRSEWDGSIRQAFVLPVNREQREMAGSIILYFYTLSAGFRLRIPMPPYLPPAEAARERLVDAIRDLDVVKRRSVRGGGRHLLFFAYALAMQEVIAELDYLGSLLQDAFGVISASASGPREFDELFVGGPGDGDEHIHTAHLAFDSSFHFRS